MYESIEPEMLAHPFRVLVPVLPLEQVVQDTEAVEQSVGLLRSRDQLNAYLYLPPLGAFLEEESVGCLYRPTIVTENFLAEPPTPGRAAAARGAASPQGQARRVLGSRKGGPRRPPAERAWRR